jgi:8-oxo-dGTP pyrophosphatase MutT (NUDIX family)
MTLHANVTATLRAWRPAQPGQESLRQAFLGFLAARTDACQRSCVPGHITASAILLDAPGERVLLTLHPKVGSWIQLGGHCEASDRTVAGVALREATEESGIDGLRVEPEPVRIEVYPTMCTLGVPTRHFDICFRGHAPISADQASGTDPATLRWWPVNALPSDLDGVATFLAG